MGFQKKSPAGKKKTKPATRERLRTVALYHLERYASSRENLRQLLLRRVYKSARQHNTDPAEGEKHIEEIIADFIRQGLLNDAEYCRMKVNSLRRRGNSAHTIRQKLTQKGLPDDLITRQLEETTTEPGHSDLQAAIAYIRRRRLGPLRCVSREDFREKDMAALGRQGFSYELVRRVIDCKSPEALEEILDEEKSNRI